MFFFGGPHELLDAHRVESERQRRDVCLIPLHVLGGRVESYCLSPTVVIHAGCLDGNLVFTLVKVCSEGVTGF